MAGGMKRGEIRWYKFASPDKRRPVLILTRDSFIEYLGEVTVATGRIGRAIVTLPAEEIEQIRRAVAFALNL